MDRSHLAVRLAESFARHPDRVATRVRKFDRWVTQTYAEFGTSARGLAARLVAEGINAGDRVALFSANRPEWSLVDLACADIRAVSVPLYHTSTSDQVRHILADAGCVVAVVDGRPELARLSAVWDDLPELRRVYTFEPTGSDDPRVVTLASVQSAAVEPWAEEEVAARIEAARGDELASIIYTSGTTGEPRGAMLTHRGFTFQIDALDKFFTITEEDSSLCFLPLSHALERAWTYVVLSHGCMNTYVADAKKVAEALVEAKPTMFASVPRLYEKVYTTAHHKVSGSPAKKAIFEWALRVGGQCQRAYRKGKEPAPYWKAQLGLADRLVLSSIRDALGGPKSVMACGGAPLRREIEEFFSAAGLLLSQGYGLTEASPLVSFNAPAGFKFGTCGRVVFGGELKVGAEGEILYRGPNVMEGYWNKPEASAQAVDADGWLHTGDVGYVDTDGYLVITDRLKDIIITSGGKNIAPAPIEGTILSDPLFEQAVLLGNNRPYLTLLVSPSMPQLEALAERLQIRWADRSELLNHPDIAREIRRRVQELTSRFAHHEQVRDLRVLLEEFTSENGLLTPTLKVRRKEVEKRFAQLIEDMYSRVNDFRGRSD